MIKKPGLMAVMLTATMIAQPMMIHAENEYSEEVVENVQENEFYENEETAESYETYEEETEYTETAEEVYDYGTEEEQQQEEQAEEQTEETVYYTEEAEQKQDTDEKADVENTVSVKVKYDKKDIVKIKGYNEIISEEDKQAEYTFEENKELIFSFKEDTPFIIKVGDKKYKKKDASETEGEPFYVKTLEDKTLEYHLLIKEMTDIEFLTGEEAIKEDPALAEEYKKEEETESTEEESITTDESEESESNVEEETLESELSTEADISAMESVSKEYTTEALNEDIDDSEVLPETLGEEKAEEDNDVVSEPDADENESDDAKVEEKETLIPTFALKDKEKTAEAEDVNEPKIENFSGSDIVPSSFDIAGLTPYNVNGEEGSKSSEQIKIPEEENNTEEDASSSDDKAAEPVVMEMEVKSPTVPVFSVNKDEAVQNEEETNKNTEGDNASSENEENKSDTEQAPSNDGNSYQAEEEQKNDEQKQDQNYFTSEIPEVTEAQPAENKDANPEGTIAPAEEQKQEAVTPTEEPKQETATPTEAPKQEVVYSPTEAPKQEAVNTPSVTEAAAPTVAPEQAKPAEEGQKKNDGSEQKQEEKKETGKITVMYVDENNTPISDISAVLVTESGNITTSWKSENSAKELTDIEPGVYSVETSSVPEGWLVPAGQTVNVQAGETPAEITIAVRKSFATFIVSDADGNVVPGTKAIIKDEAGNIVLEHEMKAVSSETGESVAYPRWTEYSMKAGNYTLSLEQPAGWASMEPLAFTLSGHDEGTEISFVMQPIVVNIYVKNLSTNEFVKGAEFVMKDANGKEVVSWTTNDRALNINKLPIGHYFITAKSVPACYMLPAQVEILAEDIPKPQDFGIALKYTVLKIMRIDTNTGDYVSGSGLRLKKENGETVQEWTSESSTKVFEGVSAGKYYIEEIKAPDKYNLAEKVYFTLTQNEPASVKIQSSKTDAAAQNGQNNVQGNGKNIVQTGDTGYTSSVIAGMFAAIFAAIGSLFIRKKKED